jgi:hypothetical protein
VSVVAAVVRVQVVPLRVAGVELRSGLLVPADPRQVSLCDLHRPVVSMAGWVKAHWEATEQIPNFVSMRIYTRKCVNTLTVGCCCCCSRSRRSLSRRLLWASERFVDTCRPCCERPEGMTSGRWSMPAPTVVPYIGLWKGRWETEAVEPIHSSRCVVVLGILNYHPWRLHPKDSKTSSQQQRYKPTGSTNKFTNTTQLWRSHRLGLRWTVVSTEVEVDPRHFASVANPITSLVPSFRVTETAPHMHSYIYITHKRPSITGWNTIRHSTQSSCCACRISPSLRKCILAIWISAA